MKTRLAALAVVLSVWPASAPAPNRDLALSLWPPAPAAGSMRSEAGRADKAEAAPFYIFGLRGNLEHRLTVAPTRPA